MRKELIGAGLVALLSIASPAKSSEVTIIRLTENTPGNPSWKFPHITVPENLEMRTGFENSVALSQDDFIAQDYRIKIRVPKKGYSLTKLAKQASELTGELITTDTIHKQNREIIGPNPDLIHEGQEYTVEYSVRQTFVISF